MYSISGEAGLVLCSILTVIVTWLWFFTSWYDGVEYAIALIITLLCCYVGIIAMVITTDKNRVKKKD